MKCEECGMRTAELFTLPSGVKLCAECCSAFISWEMDGGMLADPDMWAWAETDTMLARVGAHTRTGDHAGE